MKRLLFFLICVFFSKTSYSNVDISINKGIDISTPIGISSFEWVEVNENNNYENISKIISCDLQNSGKFSPIEIYKESNKSIEKQIKNNSINLNKLNINTILTGKISLNYNGEYLISYKLIDLVNYPGKILLSGYRTVHLQSFRKVAHEISNEIFKKLTGIQGVFHTRIAYILYNKNNEYKYKLCISDYDGYNQNIIHQSNMPLMSPSWSPDGKKIAYVTFEKGSSEIKIKDIKTGSIKHISSFPYHNGAPAFSPNGENLAFALSKTGSLNLYVMNLKNGYIKQITHGNSNNTEPSWFPDNNSLAYTSDQSGTPQIYKINISNGKFNRLSWLGSKNQNANVSPDGKFIAMVNSEKKSQHIALFDINMDNAKIITETFLDEAPSISPNNVMIIYTSSYGDSSVIELISTNGRFKTSILKINGQIKFPAWSQKI
ncbi:tolB [Wigglesworthia glossinidia endosymbiont of Glossina brevipalpis]|uniref:Tol-Pal system protein TolB n=1 Tax=Wigglesworthia glossinidia brevipalpis TaxID=36870 RepID=TOLB_WIGBR|nr:RecName: Full=Tol-Pal system protein TolB; Flags: Precursor [Wigglesworthia glossinidia endosymbiont of Glossina brevipalpis]BAC24558.1 tolB [Wigglesworthia glossinidia endosymbiont of Glossina brevipalpis]